MPLGSETALAVAEEQLEANSIAEDAIEKIPNRDGAKHALASSDDGSSSLSELGDPIGDNDDSDEDGNEEENNNVTEDGDSEAETERLHKSPEKLRTASSGGKPSTIRRNNAQIDRQPGALPTGSRLDDNGTSRTESPEASDSIVNPMPALDSLGAKKRKRSEHVSHVDGDIEGEPLRKRSSATRLNVKSNSLRRSRSGDNVEMGGAIEEDPETTSNEGEALDKQSGNDVLPGSNRAQADAGASLAAALSEKDEDAEEAVDELEDDVQTPEIAADEEDIEIGEEDIDIDGEDAEGQAKNDDEFEKKKIAMDALKPIENFFAILKDQLFNERDAFYLAEIEALKEPSSTHVEYLAMRQCLDARRDEKLQLEHTYLAYRSRDLETRTLAERAQIHSQFAQRVRTLRDDYLTSLNEKFCKIKGEFRRFKVQEPQYMYKFNPKRSQQIQQQRAYNQEVSLLSGIARHVGFPAAPDFPMIKQAEVEEDLRKMKIRHRPTSYTAQIVNSARADEAAAEEQFLENNPWANPNHPYHQNAVLVELGQTPQAYRASSLNTPSNPRWTTDIHHKSNGTPSILAAGSEPSSGGQKQGLALKRTTSRDPSMINGSPYNRSQSKYNSEDVHSKHMPLSSPSQAAILPPNSNMNQFSSDAYPKVPSSSHVTDFGTPRQETGSARHNVEHVADRPGRFAAYNRGIVSSPGINVTGAKTVGGVS